MLISITDEGRLCLADYRSIHRAILTVLFHHTPMRMIDLVFEVRKGYHEFRYLKHTIIAQAIGELYNKEHISLKEIETY